MSDVMYMVHLSILFFYMYIYTLSLTHTYIHVCSYIYAVDILSVCEGEGEIERTVRRVIRAD